MVERARAARGHAAAPPMSVMNSRRLMCSLFFGTNRDNSRRHCDTTLHQRGNKARMEIAVEGSPDDDKVLLAANVLIRCGPLAL